MAIQVGGENSNSNGNTGRGENSHSNGNTGSGENSNSNGNTGRGENSNSNGNTGRGSYMGHTVILILQPIDSFYYSYLFKLYCSRISKHLVI